LRLGPVRDGSAPWPPAEAAYNELKHSMFERGMASSGLDHLHDPAATVRNGRLPSNDPKPEDK